MKKRSRKPDSKRRAVVTTPPPAGADVMAAVEEPTQPQGVAEVKAEGGDTPDEARGFAGSYARFESAARAVDRRDVATFNATPMVVFHNARRGALEVLAARGLIESDPDAPKVDFARVEATIQVGEALVFATRRVTLAAVTKGELQEKTAKMFEAREVLMTSAVAAITAKVVTDPKQVDAFRNIQKGKGPIDDAQDCVDIAGWFTTNADALRGKTAVTAEQIRDAARLGSELLHLLAPAGVEAAGTVASPTDDAIEMRDRMMAVLVQHHAYVARVAGWLWGLDAANHVPPLRSRGVERAAPPVPPAPPAPTG